MMACIFLNCSYLLKLHIYLFTPAIDEFTKDIQDNLSWYMLFANDIVLIVEAAVDGNTNLVFESK